MKKMLILIVSVLVLSACGNIEVESDSDSVSDDIKYDETMDYFERLLVPFIETQHLETEDEMFELLKEMDNNSVDIRRELKREYQEGIPAVNALIDLSETLIGMSKDASDEKVYLMSGYTEEISEHIYFISTEYLDGDLPSNYAELIGVNNLYDLRN